MPEPVPASGVAPDLAPAPDVGAIVAALAACAGRFDVDGPDADPLDVLAHQLQCATMLRRQAPDDLELAVAGLVHDVGHQLAPGCLAAHGDVAAAYVRPVLGARVARLVALHVPAKRYLVTTDARYADHLSRASTLSLDAQGGALTPGERSALEADPDLADGLVLRRADEAAKVPGRSVAGLDAWIPALEAVTRSAAIDPHAEFGGAAPRA